MLDRSRGGSPPEGITPEGVTRGEFLKLAGAAGLVVTASGSAITVLASPAGADVGSFGAVFVEPWIYYPNRLEQEFGNRVRTRKECIPHPKGAHAGRQFCKPAAGSNGLRSEEH